MVEPAVSQTERPGSNRTGGEDRLVLAADVVARIERSLEGEYPREGCGVLLGRLCEDHREVTRAVSARNVWTGRSDRYQIDPAILRRLHAAEDEGGTSILGFYHSHPDADPKPSLTDREMAWPWYHYVIWPIGHGVAGVPRGWKLAEDGFVEITLDVGREDFASDRR